MLPFWWHFLLIHVLFSRYWQINLLLYICSPNRTGSKLEWCHLLTLMSNFVSLLLGVLLWPWIRQLCLLNLQTSEFENSPCLSKSYITKAWQYSRENRLQSKHNSFNQRDHAMPCHLCVFHFNWSWKCGNFICKISPQPRNKYSFHHDDDNKFPFNILKPKFSLDPLNRRLHSFTVVILSFLF